MSKDTRQIKWEENERKRVQFYRSKLLNNFQIPLLLSVGILYLLFTHFSLIGLLSALAGIGFMLLCRSMADRQLTYQSCKFCGSSAWKDLDTDLIFAFAAIMGILSRDYLPYLFTGLYQQLANGDEDSAAYIVYRVLLLVGGMILSFILTMFALKEQRKDTLQDVLLRWSALCLFFAALLQFFFKEQWSTAVPAILPLLFVSFCLAVWRVSGVHKSQRLPVKRTAWLTALAGIALLLLKFLMPGYRFSEYRLEGMIGLELLNWQNLLVLSLMLAGLWCFNIQKEWDDYPPLYAMLFCGLLLLKSWTWFWFELGWVIPFAFGIFSLFMFRHSIRQGRSARSSSLITLGTGAGLLLLQVCTYYGYLLFGLLLTAAVLFSGFCIWQVFRKKREKKVNWQRQALCWQAVLSSAAICLLVFAAQHSWSPRKVLLFIALLVISSAAVWALNFRSGVTHNLQIYRPVTAAVCALSCGLFLFAAMKGALPMHVTAANPQALAGAAIKGETTLEITMGEAAGGVLSAVWRDLETAADEDGEPDDPAEEDSKPANAVSGFLVQPGQLDLQVRYGSRSSRSQRWYYSVWPVQQEEDLPEAISLMRKNITLVAGERYSPFWSMDGGCKEDCELVQDSSNPCLSLSSGVIRAKEAGEEIVTLRSINGLEDQLEVTVLDKPEGIQLDQTYLTMLAEDEERMEFTLFEDHRWDADVKAKSSDKKIAAVECNETEIIITAKKAGFCTITVTTSQGGTDECDVLVK